MNKSAQLLKLSLKSLTDLTIKFPWGCENVQKFKVMLFIITLSLCLFVPLTSFAQYNTSALDKLDNLPNYTKITPDIHYVLDEDKAYQMIFVGNDNILNYDLTEYDFVLLQTAVQPISTGHNLVLSGADKSYNIYVSAFGADMWTPIAINDIADYEIYTDLSGLENWDSLAVAINTEFYAMDNGEETQALDYFYYLPDSDYSILDYNGNKTVNEHILAKFKLISHVFVNRFLKPIFDIILADTLLLIIVLTGFVVSIVSSIISIVYFIFNKKTVKKRVNR